MRLAAFPGRVSHSTSPSFTCALSHSSHLGSRLQLSLTQSVVPEVYEYRYLLLGLVLAGFVLVHVGVVLVHQLWWLKVGLGHLLLLNSD